MRKVTRASMAGQIASSDAASNGTGSAPCALRYRAVAEHLRQRPFQREAEFGRIERLELPRKRRQGRVVGFDVAPLGGPVRPHHVRVEVEEALIERWVRKARPR